MKWSFIGECFPLLTWYIRSNYFIYVSYFLIRQPAMDAVARLTQRKMNGLVLNFSFLFFSFEEKNIFFSVVPNNAGPMI